MTTLNIRIEENIKAKANKTLSSLGLDMSTAIKIFLNQVITDNGLPFIPTNKNHSFLKAKWEKEITEALKSGKSYKNAKDLFEDIN